MVWVCVFMAFLVFTFVFMVRGAEPLKKTGKTHEFLVLRNGKHCWSHKGVNLCRDPYCQLNHSMGTCKRQFQNNRHLELES